jgi:hypothetical protein
MDCGGCRPSLEPVKALKLLKLARRLPSMVAADPVRRRRNSAPGPPQSPGAVCPLPFHFSVLDDALLCARITRDAPIGVGRSAELRLAESVAVARGPEEFSLN